MELYKKTGTNPLSSCLPLLLQMPIFFGLFQTLEAAAKSQAGVGPMSALLGAQFGHSKLFGVAQLSQSFSGALSEKPQNVAVMVIAAIMVVLMTGSQFFTQLQIVSKNMSAETKASPQFKQQRILLYLLPFVFLFSGFAFPLGVMFYWLTSNIWTMVQQFVVIRNMPTPGSEAAKAREARLARKGKLVNEEGAVILSVEEPKKTQREQPVGKNRAKKQSGGKK
jgi:YidC/Oxa1 family membrane protein insertase